MSELKRNQQKTVQSKMGVLAIDKRKHPRYSVELPLSYSRVDQKELFGGIVANASGGGILVYLPERMEIGAVLRIEIFYLKDLALEAITVVAKVVWTDLATKGSLGEHRYGLEFQYVEERNYNQLLTLLEEVGN